MCVQDAAESSLNSEEVLKDSASEEGPASRSRGAPTGRGYDDDGSEEEEEEEEFNEDLDWGRALGASRGGLLSAPAAASDAGTREAIGTASQLGGGRNDSKAAALRLPAQQRHYRHFVSQVRILFYVLPCYLPFFVCDCLSLSLSILSLSLSLSIYYYLPAFSDTI
jgi:hypothetical protein